jgi:hypothetical protein
LKSPASDHRQPAHLADHRGERGRAQSLFERPQDVVVACRANQRDPRRVEPMPGEARPIQVALLEAPQDHAARMADSPGDGGSEPGSGSAVFLIGAGAEYLVQRAERQPAGRQRPIDRRDPERQHPVAQRIRPFEAPNALLQINKRSRR